MNKMLAIFICTVAMSRSLSGIDAGENQLNSKSSYEECVLLGKECVRDQGVVSKGLTVSVSTPADLVAAITNAATNLHESTTIRIHGVIVGNFTVPATIHSIKLVGADSGATISANGGGTPLSINLGATVLVDKLIITQAGGEGGYGILNYGTLTVRKSSIINNATEGGIGNFGGLTIKYSNINSNTGVGVYTQTGGVTTIENSTVNENSSTGVYCYSGEVNIANSTVNTNGSEGIYCYYGTKLSISNTEIAQNVSYGLETAYSGFTSVQDSSIHGNGNSGVYNEGTWSQFVNTSIGSNTGYGIYNYEYAVVSLSNCNFTYNTTGGIYNTDASVLFINESVFDGNVSTGNGGAIFNDGSSSVNVTKSTFVNNQAVNGGAIYSDNMCNIENSKFKNNISSVNGGALFNTEESSFVMRNSDLVDNTATGNGGGFYNLGTATVINSDIHRNSAVMGGGFANITSGSLAVITSRVVKNTATYGVGGGGGIYSTGGSLMIEDSHIAHNTPDQIVQ